MIDNALEETLGDLVDEYLDWLRKVLKTVRETELSPEEKLKAMELFSNSGVYTGHIYILECLDKKEKNEKET